MACALTRKGVEFTAPKDSAVTVKVVANATNLVGAQYNAQDLTPADNTVQLTVVAGRERLFLTLAGPPDDVDIVEDCDGGQTQNLFGYKNEFHPLVTLLIEGV